MALTITMYCPNCGEAHTCLPKTSNGNGKVTSTPSPSSPEPELFNFENARGEQIKMSEKEIRAGIPPGYFAVDIAALQKAYELEASNHAKP